jgi:hypothetical protein
MKNILLKIAAALILLSFLLLTNCKKKKDVPVPIKDSIDTTKGKIDFYLNDGKEDMFHVKSNIIENKLCITGCKLKQVEDQLVAFHYFSICLSNNTLIKQKIVKQNSNNPYSDSTSTWASFGTMQDDGDAGCEYFDVNEADTLNNFVQITKQQNNFAEIWGNFSVSFNKISSCASGFYPNTIVIKNGYFHVFVK